MLFIQTFLNLLYNKFMQFYINLLFTVVIVIYACHWSVPCDSKCEQYVLQFEEIFARMCNLYII